MPPMLLGVQAFVLCQTGELLFRKGDHIAVRLPLNMISPMRLYGASVL